MSTTTELRFGTLRETLLPYYTDECECTQRIQRANAVHFSAAKLGTCFYLVAEKNVGKTRLVMNMAVEELNLKYSRFDLLNHLMNEMVESLKNAQRKP